MIGAVLRAAALLLMFGSVGAYAGETLRLAVTTSFHNSGLSDVLLPAVQAETGLTVDLLVVGTGQALRLGQAGDVDAVFVHSPAAEKAFVAAGYAPHRTEIMDNDFVILGPRSSIADVAAAESAHQAFSAIAAAGAPFVSRGDDSGTHRRERAIWSATQHVPDGADDPWYREVGGSMGATLNIAAAMGAYTLSDRASWLNFANKADLTIVFEGGPALFNQYAYLPISQDRHPHVNADLAAVLEAFLISPEGQQLIGAYQIDGETPFTPNPNLAAPLDG
ncbi:MAG: substrate-binding domain-containing protein [Pseudomonadota bacterium]